MIEKLYTVEEVAELASVTGRTIRNYLKSGRLVGRKIGGQWRFPESEVQRLLSGPSNVETSSQPSSSSEEPARYTTPAASQTPDAYTHEFVATPNIPAPVEEEAEAEMPEPVQQAPNYNDYQQPAPLPKPVQPPLSKPAPQASPTQTQPNHTPNSYNMQQHQVEVDAQPHATTRFSVPAGEPSHSPVQHPDLNVRPRIPVQQHNVEPYQQQHRSVNTGYSVEQNPAMPSPQGHSQQPEPSVQQQVPQQPQNTQPDRNIAPAAPYTPSPPVYDPPATYTPPPALSPQPVHNPSSGRPEVVYHPSVAPLPYQQQQQPMAPPAEQPVYSQPTYYAPPPQPQASPVVPQQPYPATTPEQNNEQRQQQPQKTEQEEPNKTIDTDNFPEFSEVGKRVARFIAEVHDCAKGPQICSIIDLNQSLSSAKSTSARLNEIARQESEAGIPCECLVEFDERYLIARYTIFGSSAYLQRCLNLIG